MSSNSGANVKLTDSSGLESFNFPQNSGGGEEIREMSEGGDPVEMDPYHPLLVRPQPRAEISDSKCLTLLNTTRRRHSDLSGNTTFTLQWSNLICAR